MKQNRRPSVKIWSVLKNIANTHTQPNKTRVVVFRVLKDVAGFYKLLSN